MSEQAAPAPGTALPVCPHCGEEHPADRLKCPHTDLDLPLAGRILHDKFQFVRHLGKGGMASVWAAINTLVDRPVAIKLIRPEAGRDEETVARFRTEAKAAGRIAHANVCQILDFGIGPVGPYIVMERLRGKSLGEFIRQRGRLDAALTASIVRQALLGLDAAHRRGIIHRDLKPENLFIHQPEDGPPIVKIMDFGVSKLTDGSGSVKTEHGALLGTPEYMSPEQFKGAAQADERTDLWAMGAILYKALTGRPAFGGPTVAATLLSVTTDEPTPIVEHVRDVPPELVAVVERCLDKDPKGRFASARELSDELSAFDLGTLADVFVASRHPTGVHGIADPAPADASARAQPDPQSPAATADAHETQDTTAPRATVGDEPSEDRGEESPTSARSSGPTAQADVAAEHPPNADTDTELPTTRRRPQPEERKAGWWPWLGAAAVLGGLVVAWNLGVFGGATAASGDNATPPATATAKRHAEPATAQPTPPTEPGTATTSAASDDAAPHDGESGKASSDDDGDAEPAAAGTTTGAEPSDDDDAAPPSDDADSGGPEPLAEPPTPPGTIRVGRYLTLKKPGPSTDHTEARAYCRNLGEQKFVGVSEWKLASPTVAKKVSSELKKGRYWTNALWRGNAIILRAPTKKTDSRAANRAGPRALCVARWP